MKNNLLGYQIEPKKTSAEKALQFNHQPFFIIINFIMYNVYFLTKHSYLYKSYHSNSSYFFYSLLLIYSLMLYYYAKASGPPGFANDETEITKIDETNLDPNQYFCKYCHIYVPPRASHCLTCNKCIIRRDHHCPYTNNCIGRDNHLYFLIFTTLAFTSYIIPDIDAILHIKSNFEYSDNYFDLIKGIGLYLSFIVATSFASFMTYNLVAQCIITIVKNATTWERARRARITYLKDLPYGYSPFDKGLAGNIIEFCTMKEKKMKWDIKPPDISLFSNELQILKDNNGNIPEI